MKAIILCAGYGERLKPLTNFLPKPLFPILGTPIIASIIAHLNKTDIKELFINTHHLADKIKNYCNNWIAMQDNNYLNTTELPDTSKQRKTTTPLKLHTLYEPAILGVAGGIENITSNKIFNKNNALNNEDFIVYNGDILTNIDLKPVIKFHKKEKPVITLVLHDYPEFNKITISSTNNITSINSTKTETLAFTGVSIMSPEIFALLTHKEYAEILDIYKKLIPNKIKGYVVKNHYWMDIGTPEKYMKTHEDILISKKIPEILQSQKPIYIGKNSFVSPLASMKEFVSIGNNCTINDNVKLENCIIWDNIKIKKNTIASKTIFYEQDKKLQVNT